MPENISRFDLSNQDIFSNCIDRALLILTDNLNENKGMCAEQITATVNGIDKLLAIRKEFIRDYFTHPIMKQEVAND
jgi:hypothetical protein